MNSAARRDLEDLLDREIEVARSLAATLAEERSALTGDSTERVAQKAAHKLQLFETLEKLEAERRLEPFDELRDAFEPSHGHGVIRQKRLGVVDRTGHEVERLVGRVAAVAIPRDEVPLHRRQDVPEIFRVRAVRALHVVQAELFSGLLREVHQLVNFEERHERIHEAGEVAIHQADEHGAPGGRLCERRHLTNRTITTARGGT